MTLSLARRADLWGDRTAVVDATAGRRVSYADLEAEADAMARRLAALGVGPGDAVAVVSRNRVETLAALFAVRRLGAVLAPVSHRLTPATVEHPLDVVDPAVVVHEPAQRDLVRELPGDETRTFEDLGRHDAVDYGRVDRDPEDSLLYLHTRADADRPAVGENEGRTRPGETLNEEPTAAPRVVALPERTVEWNCVTAAAAWGLGRGDCAPALLPFSDTDGLHRLVLPLLYVGGRIVLHRAFDADDAATTVDREDATALFAGATEYRELVEDDAFADADLGSVEWFGTRSALPADVREALARRAPVVRAYGRVETGPNDLFVPPSRASDPDSTPDPDLVGRPFPDCEVRIAGEDGDPVPAGDVGELRFRGPVTARGYLARDDGERHVDAFPEWVPTGELAYREGGDVYLLGRVDETLTADERVHPREVERALESRDDVTAAGVVPDEEGVAVAYVGDADPGELRSALADALPEGAPVRELDRRASLPRRTTGELDRARLRRDLSGEERIDEG